MAEKTVSVPGISCGHCVKTIEREVAELDGVQSVSASQEERTVTVRWDEASTGWAAVRELLEEIDYPPSE